MGVLNQIPSAVMYLWLGLDVALRGFALWRASQRRQKIWFVALLLVNSLGILPLIYLIYSLKIRKTVSPKKII
jgi:hypothetical protein